MVADPALPILDVAIFSYIFGIFSGFYIRSFVDKKLQGKLEGSYIILIVISSVWLLSMVVDILSASYETSPLVHGLMGVIVGFFYKAERAN